MRALKTFLFTFCLTLFVSASAQTPPLKQFNLSVWTDYTGMKFDGFSQTEKTAKLQALFADLLKFAKTHKSRRLLIRALNPASFAFFNPENFNSERDDNFYYFATKLKKYGEIEIVFEPSPFHLGSYSWKEWFLDSAIDFFKIERPLGSFHNIHEKLAWVSILNEMLDPYFRLEALVKGITIDPSGLTDGCTQLVINVLDQYRFNALPEELPPNRFDQIRTALLVSLDQKELAFANLAHFPLLTDVRGEKPLDTGISVPENFPGRGVECLTPQWRMQDNRPLLDTVYVNMADPRLVDIIYQNHSVLSDPAQKNSKGVKLLAHNLGRNFRNEPFVKGPGTIWSKKGSNMIEGLYTFFKTGGPRNKGGQFISGGKIEIRPPYVDKTVCKVISEDPINNRKMRITSSFSTTKDLSDVEYYLTATPVRWDYPKISEALLKRIYFVFSTEFNPTGQKRYFGNWHLKNFISFLYNSSDKRGFLYEKIFTTFSEKKVKPVNNLVLHDFTNIPNGGLTDYPEYDWKLGNHNH